MSTPKTSPRIHCLWFSGLFLLELAISGASHLRLAPGFRSKFWQLMDSLGFINNNFKALASIVALIWNRSHSFALRHRIKLHEYQDIGLDQDLDSLKRGISSWTSHSSGCFNETSTTSPAALTDTYTWLANIASSIHYFTGLFSLELTIAVMSSSASSTVILSRQLRLRLHLFSLIISWFWLILLFLPPVIVAINTSHQDNGRRYGVRFDAWGVHLGEIYSVLAAAYSVVDMISPGLAVQP